MRDRSAVLVGIAGGVASGKTTVGKLFQEWGARLIEADAIGWELLRLEEVKKRLTDIFGKEILNPRGDIERKKLGRIVFSTQEAREKLNAIVHGPLLRRLKARIDEAKETSIKGVIAVVAALIPEWEIGDWFDKLIVVTCSEETAVQRLLRQGFSEEETRNRIGSQLPEEEKVKGADFVIDNSEDLVSLRKAASEVWEAITRSHTLLSS